MNEQPITPETLIADLEAGSEPVETTDASTDSREQTTSNTAENNHNIPKINYEIELKEQKEKYLRLHAEFDTARRRMARERIEMTQMASREVITELLPILDDFERAFKAVPQDSDTKGFELIYHKFKSLLEQKGLEAMKTIGEPFNPEWHEAIAEIPAPNEQLSGKVIDEVEKGYYLHKIIIRYAKVVVGKWLNWWAAWTR